MTAPSPRSVRRDAWLSPDGVYRYALLRAWDETPECMVPRVAWVMLNPSTADAEVDDPTIRRCMGFTRSWGFERMVVVNLWALRSTDPAALLTHPAPEGPENGAAHDLALGNADRIIAAWGASYPPKLKGTVLHAREALRDRGAVCLGKTASGSPRHPLYVRGDAQVVAL